MSAKQFDISQLPSLEHMSAKDEAQRRMKTVRFIYETCRLLKLPRVATATAAVFFHRFYAKHSFETHDRFEVAIAAILLAAKTEESPKKIGIIIDEAYKLRARSNTQSGRLSQAGMDASPEAASAAALAQQATTTALDPKSEEFAKLKERVLLLERVILHTIGFELSVTHPYKYILEFSKRAIAKKQVEFINEEETKGLSTLQAQQQLTNKVVQIAMNFANDSFQTSLCLQASPEEIATACMFLAFQYAGTQTTQNISWLDVLGHPEVEQLTSVSLQIIELMTDQKGMFEKPFLQAKLALEKLKDEIVRPANEEPPTKKLRAT